MRVSVLLAVILLAGAWLRMAGTDWDRSFHLHPDERYLSIVANDIAFPDSLGGYLDVGRSPLSPYNVQSGRSYLYGTLPLFTTKLVARALGEDRYDRLYLVGRRMSALLDLVTVGLVFLLGRRLVAPAPPRAAAYGGLVAAALYALTVLAIQHAHFFTVDSWLTAFATLTLLLATGLTEVRSRPRLAVLLAAVGVALGLTLACKVNGALVAVAVFGALVWRLPRPRTRRDFGAAAAELAKSGAIVLLAAYLSFRAVSPYAFASSSWLDLTIQPDLSAALRQQRDALAGNALSPPAYQWFLSAPVISPLENLALWALAPALAAAVLAGFATGVADGARALWHRARAGRSATHTTIAATLTVAYVAVAFAYSASRFGHPLRYLLPLIPALCSLAGVALVRLCGRRRRIGCAVTAAVIAVTGLWALAFVAVYRHPNTRVAASEWIDAHVPGGATIAGEHWDDALPLPVGRATYTGVQLPVFDADDAEKPDKLYAGLSGARYYVLSSPRAWRTVGRLPGRFPMMTRFYRALFAGDLGFREVARFTSPPRLLGIAISDASAEEAFSVYDHPEVRVFERTASLTRAEFRDILLGRA
jgi:hypothetical protein